MKIVVYGGSNSFISHGYTKSLCDKVSEKNGEVEFVNESMGNTFIHYGLGLCIKNKSHLNADVAIIEYCINDQEIFNLKANFSWGLAYEGLLRKIRSENPTCRVISLILYPRSRYRSRLSAMAMRVSYLTARYGGEVIDVEDEFDKLEISDEAKNIYVDASHYSRRYHQIIGEIVAKRIFASPQYLFGSSRLPSPIYPENYATAKIASAVDIFAGCDGTSKATMSNSRVSIDTLKMIPGANLPFTIDGEIIGLTYAATRADGIIKISHGTDECHISAYRSSFVSPKKDWPFLTSLIVPALATSVPLAGGHRDASIELLSSVGSSKNVFMRGTQRAPQQGIEHSLHLLDIIYSGSIARRSVSAVEVDCAS